MDGTFVPWTPPKWVPGPYQEPATPAAYKRPVRQPSWRFIDVPSTTTLMELAMRYYRSPQEAMRIFNNNRDSDVMPDGTYGSVFTPNDTIMPGTRIWLD